MASHCTARPSTLISKRGMLSAAIETLEVRQFLSAELVKDFNTNTADGVASSNTAEYNGAIYFLGRDLEHGHELWRTNGTAAGTTLFRDTQPGPADFALGEIKATGGLLYYTEIAAQPRLWRTDGTDAGTFPVSDAGGAQLTEFNGALYFVRSSAGAAELWTSDGTVAGTALVKSFPSSTLTGLRAVGGKLAFHTQSGSVVQTWYGDGTTAGTVAATHHVPLASVAVLAGRWLYLSAGSIRSFDPATGVSSNVVTIPTDVISVGSLTTMGDAVYFPVTKKTGDFGQGRDYALWRTDGNQAGTAEVRSLSILNPLQNLTPLNGKLYFTLGTALYRSDGTSAGTQQVRILAIDNPNVQITGMSAVGDDLYINATVGKTTLGNDVHAAWASDGTADGTFKIFQQPPNITFPLGPYHPLGGRAFFPANTVEHGRELWSSDGTPQGTTIVKDVNTATLSGSPSPEFEHGGRLYYSTAVGLWSTDGTTAGTQEFFPAGYGYFGHTHTMIFLTKLDGLWLDLFASDGTPGQVTLLKRFSRHTFQDSIHAPFRFGNRLYFGARTGSGFHLWSSDGTPAGTVPVTMLAQSPSSNEQFTIVPDGNKMLMTIDNQIWRSDGTAAGTARVTTTPALSSIKSPTTLNDGRVGALTTFGGVGYFIASQQGRVGWRLMRTDGTTVGTRTVGSGFSALRILGADDRQLFFIADDGLHGPELWRTDGTDAGTRMVVDARPGMAGQPVDDHWGEARNARGDLMLIEMVGPDGLQVWRTDGTSAGTYSLPITTGPDSQSHYSIHNVNGTFFYANGVELWLTDGTVAGTRRVGLETPGNDVLRSAGVLREYNGRLLFSATTGRHGTELWRLTAPALQVITGTDGADQWTIRSVAEGRVGIWGGGRAEGQPNFEFGVADLLGLEFMGLAGDDTIAIHGNTSFPIRFDGGDGNDRVAMINGSSGAWGTWEVLDVYHSTFTVQQDTTVESVSVSSDGLVSLRRGGGVTLRARTLSIGDQDQIDLNDNALVLVGGDVAAVEALVKSARDGGQTPWDGPGITSSVVPGSALTGISVAQVGGDDVLARFAYNGDANGDGRVNADDYFRIDSGFLDQPQDPLYAQGDFNYDDRINADDYFLIDSAFLGQGPSLGSPTPVAAAAAAMTSPVATSSTSKISARSEDERRKTARRRVEGVWQTRQRVGLTARRGIGERRTR